MTPRLPPDNARGAVPLGRRDLEALRAFSTATVCDAIAELAPERRGLGFTTDPLVAARPTLPPIAGYARVAAIRTAAPSGLPAAEETARTREWLDHVAHGPRPAIIVLQDLDGPRHGHGACWDGVLATIHAALGCVGVLTDGAVRDMDLMPEGFQALAAAVKPSRGWLHWVRIGGTVNLAGMEVADDDVLHADASGAVVVPSELVREVPGSAARLRAQDAELLAACRRPGVEFADIKAALLGRRPSRWCP